MGTIPATTKIKHIRENLNEPLTDAELTTALAGTNWTNEALLEHLNKGKNRAWDIVRLVRENYFLVEGASLSLTATAKSYALAAAVRSVTGIRVTTAGYEHIVFRKLRMDSEEWKAREAEPLPADTSRDEFGYSIVGAGKLLLCDYPPVALTVTYDYVSYVADYTLSGSSTSDVPDEWIEFEEAYATMLALSKQPTDPRLPHWQREILRLKPELEKSVANREIRDPEFAEEYNPY